MLNVCNGRYWSDQRSHSHSKNDVFQTQQKNFPSNISEQLHKQPRNHFMRSEKIHLIPNELINIYKKNYAIFSTVKKAGIFYCSKLWQLILSSQNVYDQIIVFILFVNMIRSTQRFFFSLPLLILYAFINASS